MEQFIEEQIINQPGATYHQYLEMLLPIITKAYYLTLIQKVNPIFAFSETLLFGVNNFLTCDPFDSSMCLILETLYLVIIYLFPHVGPTACYIMIGYILFVSVFLEHFGGQHDPDIIVQKCSIFLIVKYALGAPERLLCFLWILKVLYEYIFNYKRKSLPDSILVLALYQIAVIAVLASRVNTDTVSAVSYSYAIVYMWKYVIGRNAKYASVEKMNDLADWFK